MSAPLEPGRKPPYSRRQGEKGGVQGHAALRSASHSSMKAENWFQLHVLGVTGPRSGMVSGLSLYNPIQAWPWSALSLQATSLNQAQSSCGAAFTSGSARDGLLYPSAMLAGGPREVKRLAWAAMYYLPLPWALYYALVLVPIPNAEGWSLLYYQFQSRSYWIIYAVLLGLLGVLPWTTGNPRQRWVFQGWRDFLVHLFLGYAIAMAAHLGWLLILGMCGVLGPLPLNGEDAAFAVLTLMYVPPFWAPVIGALLQLRRGDGPLIRPRGTLRR